MAVPEHDVPVQKKKRSGGPWAAGTGLLVLLSKLKPALLFLLKAGKPLATMALSIGAYALIYPWTFAVGFVLLLLVHELGHVWAARRAKVPVNAPMFIPFVGALILLKRNPKDAATEAYIGIGGPLLGTVGAFVCYAIGSMSGESIWYALAYTGFFLNLINLMPIHPLDGGRIVTAVSRWLWLVGAVLGPFIIWKYGGFIFFYIWLLFLWEMYKRFIRDRRNTRQYAVEGEYRADVDPLLPPWYFAGESHRRELPFTAYCRLDGEHVVEFSWDVLSFRGELSLPQPCLIDRVVLTQVKGPDEVRKLTFTVRMEGRLYEDEHYYEVPLGVRLRMGLLYGGLVGVLFYMIWKIGEVGLIVPA
ncbi:site-2 protease family protein [Cohnella candidum]|uniref:Site-2 protease family protein n=1 Tax=Cohnella candidum TaxID=2674991 RepID=A0A3G3K0E3_9BACL|nr:site-2 protease family protein [Cohnella candidum]AYQ73587.1 site-2 protease family protein [Cohnella candidum]